MLKYVNDKCTVLYVRKCHLTAINITPIHVLTVMAVKTRKLDVVSLSSVLLVTCAEPVLN